MPEEAQSTDQQTPPKEAPKNIAHKINWLHVLIGVVFGAVLLGVGFGVYFLTQSKSEPTNEPNQVSTPSAKQATPSADTATPSAQKDETADWETFSDKILAFSLKHPNSWYVKSSKSWSKETWSNGESRTSIYNYNPETAPPRGYDPKLDKGKVKIEVIKGNKSQDESLKYFVDKIDFQPATVTTKTNLTVGGKKAIKVEYELSSLQASFYVERDTTTVYTINFFLDYEGSKDILNQILLTFKFLPSQ